MSISHLLFADDNILFCDADLNQVQTLKALLHCFEVVSSLKVNFNKSELVPVGHVSNSKHLATILGCKVSSLPMIFGSSVGIYLKGYSYMGYSS